MMMHRVRYDRRPCNRDQDGGDNGRHQRMNGRSKLRNEKAPACSANQAAKAPEGVAGRHDRPAHLFLDRDRIGIHRHVHRGHGPAEIEHHDHSRDHVGNHCDDEQRRNEGERRHAHHNARAAMRRKSTRDRHHGQGTETEDKDH